MNKLIKLWWVFLLLFAFTGCSEDDEVELQAPPTAQDAAFTFGASTQGANYVQFSNPNPDAFLKVWNFGNGTSSKEDSPIAYYPFAGTYTVTLTIYTQGGSASATQDVTIDQTDPEICNVENLKMLTGGCDAPEGKTWIIDKDRPGHFGVGPAAETSPIWYAATANEKEGGGMYDDEYTFFLGESKFVQQTNGDVYVNPAQGSNFPGAEESPVGDLIAPYTAPDNLNYALTTDNNGNMFLNLSGGGFIGYNVGTSNYQIISLTDDEMFIKFIDAANPDLAWFHRLIRKGFIPDPPDPPSTASLPINFEGDPVPFGGFGGSNFEQIDNPDASGINTSAKVGATLKGSETWAGISVPLDGNVDFSSKTSFKMKVWSPVTGTVRFKLENADDNTLFTEVDAEITTINAWEELTFDFTGAPSDTYSLMAVFFDFGNPGNDQTFYFDDIDQAFGDTGGGEVLNIDFDNNAVEFGSFGNATFAQIDNPDASGINTSARVGEFVKTAGSEVWAGVETTLTGPLNFTDDGLIKVKVWSPNAGAVVRFKIEESTNPNSFVEIDATVTTANTWEELTWDFSVAESNKFDKIAFFLDFGVAGDATYYFDDMIGGNGTGSGGGGGGGGSTASLNIDFDNVDPAFNSFGNTTVANVANPDASGINTSAQVGEFVKTAGSEVWGGVETTLEGTLDFTTNGLIKAKVWSPNAGAVVRFKIEEASNPNSFVELDATVSAANTWEELTWDFSSATSGIYNKFAFFIDFGVAGDATYYFDDIMQASAGGGGGGGSTASLNIDFDNVDPGFNSFGNTTVANIANPDASGINTSAQVGEFVKTAGSEVWGGVETTLEGTLDFTANGLIKAKVWSPNAGAVVRFKIEEASNPNSFVELDATVSAANTWEELTWDFSSATSGIYNKFAFFIDFGVAGDATYYFDDIMQASSGGGGGGGSFDSGLLINGDFEAGREPWLAGVENTIPEDQYVTADGNSYYSVNITSPDSGQPFLVNLSQKVALTQGTTYVLSFDAWSDRSRNIIAGIGRSGGDFANNSQPVAITDSRATYTLTLTADNFGEGDNRVLFDSNGEAGLVNIDNVSLTVGGGR